MLMFAMTCLRSEGNAQALDLLMAGRFQEAVQLALPRLDRRPAPHQLQEHAALGQVIGRTLLLMDRAQDAEELFRRLLRAYEMGSLPFVRWMSSLDHGELRRAMNRPSRAAQAFGTVADDESAPAALRIEALAGVAVSVRALGEYRRASHALQVAQSLAQRGAAEPVRHLLEALQLETQVLQKLRVFDEGGDLAGGMAAASMDGPLHTRIAGCMEALAPLPFAQRRLAFLAALSECGRGAGQSSGRLFEHAADARQQRLLAHERECRVEAALAMVDAGDGGVAQELLGTLARDEAALRRDRHSLELRYCLSRIYALQGRHADALRLYKEHVAQALPRLHAELAHLPYLRCLERRAMMEQSDASKLLLPLRYRRAYQYITEHLDDRNLSVREVAAHIDVTERALQMAFRTHLGLSPAELIRRRRVERIRKDLLASDRLTVVDASQRWGMSGRSTLMQSRRMFHETPTIMLRGGDRPAPEVAVDELQ